MKTTASECPEHKVTRIEDASGKEYCPRCVRGVRTVAYSHLVKLAFWLRRIHEERVLFVDPLRDLEDAEEFIEETSVGV